MLNPRIAEIEQELGPRHEYVLRSRDFPLLKEWARLHGHDPFDVDRMKPVDLTNLYHKDAEPQTRSPDINDMILKVLEAVNAPGFEVSLTRRIARSEMQQEILS